MSQAKMSGNFAESDDGQFLLDLVKLLGRTPKELDLTEEEEMFFLYALPKGYERWFGG